MASEKALRRTQWSSIREWETSKMTEAELNEIHERLKRVLSALQRAVKNRKELKNVTEHN